MLKNFTRKAKHIKLFHFKRYKHTNIRQIIDHCSSIVGTNNVSINATIREQHGKDLTYHEGHAPDVVVYPENTDQVSKIVKMCHDERIPIIPFGAGTSLEGHITAPMGGVCFDLSKMTEIKDFHPEDLDITVQAGVTREDINNYVKDSGLFFPVDPGANATIGGMAATRASGTTAVRYGTMKENILNLEVVLPNGDVIKTGTRAKKSSSGYDLTNLFIGSEGTLGIITAITLKLYGIPECIASAVCSFPDMESAANTVIQTIQYGIPIARVELLDEACIKAVNRYSKLSNEEKPTLFFEFHGTDQSVKEQSQIVQEICSEFGGSSFDWATEIEDRNRLWKARHQALLATINYIPGQSCLITDVCVPISKLAECIVQSKEDFDKTNLFYTLVGHVGDGNFHLFVLFDKDNPQQVKVLEEANHRLVMRAIEMGGTCTGEHGIGIGKKDYMLKEHGANHVKLLKLLKKAIDPFNIMNPGKVLPSDEEILKFEMSK